jgi:hypothetical protein
MRVLQGPPEMQQKGPAQKILKSETDSEGPKRFHRRVPIPVMEDVGTGRLPEGACTGAA